MPDPVQSIPVNPTAADRVPGEMRLDGSDYPGQAELNRRWEAAEVERGIIGRPWQRPEVHLKVIVRRTRATAEQIPQLAKLVNEMLNALDRAWHPFGLGHASATAMTVEEAVALVGHWSTLLGEFLQEAKQILSSSQFEELRAAIRDRALFFPELELAKRMELGQRGALFGQVPVERHSPEMRRYVAAVHAVKCPLDTCEFEPLPEGSWPLPWPDDQARQKNPKWK